MQPPPPPRQLKVEADPSLRANYANTAVISNTAQEVVFDFIQIVPSDPRARIVDRVVMTPAHAKLLLQALAENLARHEAKHGPISVPTRPPSLADQLFSTIAPPDAPTEPPPNE
ncbi:DUF3467 domain-containing protein [Aggregatilineales bacterium SYSU G02658]